MEVVYSMQQLIDRCAGKNLLAYGTGSIGQFVIPCLEERTGLKLCGVTNSGITAEDAGFFQNTALPLRSAQAWYERLPDACVLVTTTRSIFHYEIESICKKIGFQEIVCLHETLGNELLLSELRASIGPKKLAAFHLLLPHIDAHLLNCMCWANEIRDTHRETFHEFRNCHRDQTVVLVASGPTTNYYTQIENLRHIGVNATFLNPKLQLDYYFIEDYAGRPAWIHELKKYDFVKFMGLSGYTWETKNEYRMPENILYENNARPYFLQPGTEDIHCDIEHFPLMEFGSTIFPALHFALYTRPKRILLIGCDCSSDGHFDGTPGDSSHLLNAWKRAASFISRFYPDIEIVSVNPVGLRGMFRDVYTESFLAACPEMAPAEYEMMDPEALR